MSPGARWGGCLTTIAALLFSTSEAAAQDTVTQDTVTQDTSAQDTLTSVNAAQGDQPWQLQYAFSNSQIAGDYYELLMSGGIRLRRGPLEIRAQSGVILLDREEFLVLQEGLGGEDGLPRRSAPVPAARRRVTETMLRERMRSFLRAAGQAEEDISEPPRGDVSFDLFRNLYLEDGVTIVRDGLEVVRAERLFFSPPEDRMTLEEVELRVFSTDPIGTERIITVRGDRILKLGTRWTGRNLSVTTCTAGEPHIEVFSGEIEMIERGNEFEIRSRGNHLAFSGVKLLPIPDVSYFTGEQTSLPIQGVSAGYSDKQGVEVAVELGGSMNDTGGAIHKFLTGRPAEEFRGDWNLGLGYVEERGFPIDARLNYRGGDLYFGYLEGFYMNDTGENIREITNRLDGSLIDNTDRGLVRTENRVILGPGTDLDLTLWYATDPAVYSEFFGRDYRSERFPETSVYLKSGAENRLATVKGRWDINDFSYEDTRAQAPYFIEELPFGTFDLFSEPILDMPWGTPLQLTSSTSFGQFNRNFDSTVTPATMENDTWRFDQEFELAAPFFLGDVGFRPWGSARYTYYEDTPTNTSEDRWTYAAGISAGTRLSRVWSSTDSDGNRSAIRHVMAPLISFSNRFHVEGNPTDFIGDATGNGRLDPYDSVDLLDEQALIRVQLINILQEKQTGPEREALRNEMDRAVQTDTRDAINTGFNEPVYLDLAQNFHPKSRQDANNDHLGLAEYELILRPSDRIPVPNMRLLLEGEFDWDQDENRTFNTAVNFGPVILDRWFAEYRTDAASDGTIGYGAVAKLMSRWELSGASQYDLQTGRSLNYVANLVRHDHDFALFFRIDYDNISGETNISLNFEPNFTGAFRSKRERSLYGGRLYGYGGGTIF